MDENRDSVWSPIKITLVVFGLAFLISSAVICPSGLSYFVRSIINGGAID